MRLNLLAAALLFLAALALPAAAQDAPAQSLPGGASSLQETYQDWRVACQIVSGQRVCLMSQEQAQQNGQRVMAVELRTADNGAAAGTLVMPFGLALDAGVTVRIDDGAALPALRFSTCLPAGCLAPVSFDGNMVGALRAGTALKLAATAAGNPQPVALSVSLKGFSAAYDRLVALAKG